MGEKRDECKKKTLDGNTAALNPISQRAPQRTNGLRSPCLLFRRRREQPPPPSQHRPWCPDPPQSSRWAASTTTTRQSRACCSEAERPCADRELRARVACCCRVCKQKERGEIRIRTALSPSSRVYAPLRLGNEERTFSVPLRRVVHPAQAHTLLLQLRADLSQQLPRDRRTRRRCPTRAGL